MFGNSMMKALLKKQMNGVPGISPDQQEFFLNLLEKNPDFFMQIAREAQEKIKSGMSQQDAMMAVMKAHEAELKAIVGK
jgi:hypothetical protein